MENIKRKIKWIFRILPFNLHISFDFYLYWKFEAVLCPLPPPSVSVVRAFTVFPHILKYCAAETLKIQRTWITIAHFVFLECSIRDLFMQTFSPLVFFLFFLKICIYSYYTELGYKVLELVLYLGNYWRYLGMRCDTFCSRLYSILCLCHIQKCTIF